MENKALSREILKNQNLITTLENQKKFLESQEISYKEKINDYESRTNLTTINNDDDEFLITKEKIEKLYKEIFLLLNEVFSPFQFEENYFFTVNLIKNFFVLIKKIIDQQENLIIDKLSELYIKNNDELKIEFQKNIKNYLKKNLFHIYLKKEKNENDFKSFLINYKKIFDAFFYEDKNKFNIDDSFLNIYNNNFINNNKIKKLFLIIKKFFLFLKYNEPELNIEINNNNNNEKITEKENLNNFLILFSKIKNLKKNTKFEGIFILSPPKLNKGFNYSKNLLPIIMQIFKPKLTQAFSKKNVQNNFKLSISNSLLNKNKKVNSQKNLNNKKKHEEYLKNFIFKNLCRDSSKIFKNKSINLINNNNNNNLNKNTKLKYLYTRFNFNKENLNNNNNDFISTERYEKNNNNFLLDNNNKNLNNSINKNKIFNNKNLIINNNNIFKTINKNKSFTKDLYYKSKKTYNLIKQKKNNLSQNKINNFLNNILKEKKCNIGIFFKRTLTSKKNLDKKASKNSIKNSRKKNNVLYTINNLNYNSNSNNSNSHLYCVESNFEQYKHNFLKNNYLLKPNTPETTISNEQRICITNNNNNSNNNINKYKNLSLYENYVIKNNNKMTSFSNNNNLKKNKINININHKHYVIRKNSKYHHSNTVDNVLIK